jgi:hypothetical protein
MVGGTKHIMGGVMMIETILICLAAWLIVVGIAGVVVGIAIKNAPLVDEDGRVVEE